MSLLCVEDDFDNGDVVVNVDDDGIGNGGESESDVSDCVLTLVPSSSASISVSPFVASCLDGDGERFLLLRLLSQLFFVSNG